MATKALLIFFAMAGVLAPLVPNGNPRCKAYISRNFQTGAFQLYCDNVGNCPNPCASFTSPEGYAYCPCGHADDEFPSLLCLAKIEYPNYPDLNGNRPDCESLCDGCEVVDEDKIPYSPAEPGYGEPLCSLCP